MKQQGLLALTARSTGRLPASGIRAGKTGNHTLLAAGKPEL
jgi:hypothetical protein